jgi:hypothetical protein
MQNSFNPDEISVLTKVIEEACLRLSWADDTERQMVALRVLDYAARGERDFETLLSVALNGKASPDRQRPRCPESELKPLRTNAAISGTD